MFEKEWEHIKLQKAPVDTYRSERLEMEKQLNDFCLTLRLHYGMYYRTLADPEWMRGGRKKSEKFFSVFFEKLPQLKKAFLDSFEQKSSQSISEYSSLYLKWKDVWMQEQAERKKIPHAKRDRKLKIALEKVVRYLGENSCFFEKKNMLKRTCA